MGRKKILQRYYSIMVAATDEQFEWLKANNRDELN